MVPACMPTRPCPAPRSKAALGPACAHDAPARREVPCFGDWARGIALVLVPLACTPAEPPAAIPPDPRDPDAVLFVDDLPLRAVELEPLCADIAALYPEFTRLHARRLALTNEFLPRLATRVSAPEAWARARAECEAWDPAHAETLAARRCEGGFQALGLSLWSAARHLPEGVWSDPIELTGRWLRLRLEARNGAADPLQESLALALLEFPFVDPGAPDAAIQAAIEQARLTLVDADFAAAVPEAWKHRMRGAPR